VFDWSTEDGGNIDQWEYWGGDCQLWKITPVYPQVDSGSYTVRNVNSGLFVSESSSNAIQSDAQTLTFTRLDDGTYNVSNVGGKFLTVEGNSSEDGANISFETYTGDSSQAFELVANKDGSYSLLTVSSNGDRCLDVYGISTDDGANLCQWSYWGGDGQKFVIEPVSTSQTIQGDVNSDGVCNTLDLLTLKRYLLGMDVSVTIASGDISNDGKVDISDLILLKEIIL
jgi:arabinan endo-1,5-alpha-L-arabinosidase